MTFFENGQILMQLEDEEDKQSENEEEKPQEKWEINERYTVQGAINHTLREINETIAKYPYKC